MANPKNPHEGHRERMREELLQKGIDENTPRHRILELLLFYCVPRVDTNLLAHELIEKYNNLSGVLDAPIDELVKFKGLTRKGAALLKFIIPISRIYSMEKQDKCERFRSINQVGDFLLSRYFGMTVERFSVLGLDAVGRIVFFDFVSEGDISSVGISIREIVKRVVERDCYCVILAHNHPGGAPLPSKEDVDITIEIVDALSRIGINVSDHVLISEGEYISMRLSGEYKGIFN